MKTVSSTIFLLSTSLVESQSHEDTSLLKFIHHKDKILNINTRETIPQDDNELGDAATLFSGLVEVVAEDDRFRWLESPVWSDTGNYLLFSDVSAHRNDSDTDITCGMLYKYDDASDKLTQLLKCSGFAGPPGLDDGEDGLPSDIRRRAEGGSNGLYWQNEKDGILLMQQHGSKRIVRLNVNDINEEEGTIDDDLVKVIADTYDDDMLNSPNDMVIGDDGYLYFTDPPYGLQYNDVEDPWGYAFEIMTQDKPAVYKLSLEDKDTKPERLLEYPVATAWDERSGPNGIATNNKNGDLAVVITDWNNPRTEIYSPNEEGTFNPEPTKVLLHDQYRIEGPNASLYGALADGITYDADMHVFFIASPGGISIYDTSTNEYELLGFIRVDDLCSNNVVGGGYLWMTCNRRLLRIPLALSSTSDRDASGDTEMVDTTNSASLVSIANALVMAVYTLAMILNW